MANLRIPKWMRGLTMAEAVHIVEDAGVTSRKRLERTFELQREAVAEGRMDRCFDCKHIENKLREQKIIK